MVSLPVGLQQRLAWQGQEGLQKGASQVTSYSG